MRTSDHLRSGRARVGSKGINCLADPAAYRLSQGQERLPGARRHSIRYRHRGYSPASALTCSHGIESPGSASACRAGGISQVLQQLTGVLLAHALQRLGELGWDDGRQPLPALGEVHHVPARGITGGAGFSGVPSTGSSLIASA